VAVLQLLVELFQERETWLYEKEKEKEKEEEEESLPRIQVVVQQHL
jgi:hypothetical protein